MSFTRTRAPGFWTFNSVVAPSEFEHIDDYYKAIDGAAGGAYAPSALLTIGGAGLSVTGPLTASDVSTFDVTGSVLLKLGATLTLIGNTSVSAGAIVGFGNGSFLTMSNGSTFTQNAGATATFSGAVMFNGSSFTVAEISSFTFPLYHSNKLYKNGATATTVWRETELDETQPALTIYRTADTHWVNNPTSAGTTVYTIDHSTVPVAVNGERVSVQAYNIAVGKDIDIIREDLSIIATIAVGHGGVDLQFMGGRWRLVGAWGNTTISGPV